MHRSIWMRPALQQSEAVMMPALLRRKAGEPQFSDLYYHSQAAENPFRTVVSGQTTMALSTYVRPRGSMAGRSVLIAAGVSMNPFMTGRRPIYYRSVSYKQSLTRQDFMR